MSPRRQDLALPLVHARLRGEGSAAREGECVLQVHQDVSAPKGRGEKYNLSLIRFTFLVRKSQDKTSLLPNTFQPTAPLSFIFSFFFLLTVEPFNATYEVRSGR